MHQAPSLRMTWALYSRLQVWMLLPLCPLRPFPHELLLLSAAVFCSATKHWCQVQIPVRNQHLPSPIFETASWAFVKKPQLFDLQSSGFYHFHLVTSVGVVSSSSSVWFGAKMLQDPVHFLTWPAVLPISSRAVHSTVFSDVVSLCSIFWNHVLVLHPFPCFGPNLGGVLQLV